MSDIAQLLQDLEPLSHGERMRRVVELGRRARTEPAIADGLARWAAGDFYERQLALKSCFGSGDVAIAEAMLVDPSRALRAMAVEAVAKLGDDALVARIWSKLPRRKRAELVRHLHRARRQAPIDTYLERGILEEEPGVAALLPFGSVDVVERHLEMQSDRLTVQDWARAASFHPAVVHQVLMRQAGAATVQDARLIARFNATVNALASSMPEAAVALLQALMRTTSIAHLNLIPLAEAAPEPMARLILDSADRGTGTFRRVAAHLDETTLVALAERFGVTLGPTPPDRRRAPRARWGRMGYQHGLGGTPRRLPSHYEWMRDLAPEVRERLFDLTRKFWPTNRGELSAEALSMLPFERRRQEALRIWEVPALQLHPEARAAYATLFDWPTALDKLDAYLKDPDAKIRSAALTALIRIVSDDPARLDEALAIVQSGRNEQDPVRLAMLTALGDLKLSVWGEAHLAGLDTILDDTLNVGDRSYKSQVQVMHIVAKLFPVHPEWAVRWFDRFLRHYSRMALLDYETRLTDSDMARIGAALMPVLREWKNLEAQRASYILRIVHALGTRAAAVPELLDLLEELIREDENPLSLDALKFLVDLDHRRFSELVPALLADDESWVQKEVVNEFLHRERQDLLTPVLERTSFNGRFPTRPETEPFMLPFKAGFQTWTAAQLNVFSQLLDQIEVHDDPKMARRGQVHRNAQILMQLSAMQITRIDRLRRSAGIDVADQKLRDAALRGLGRLDDGSGMPDLLEALHDTRDRIAVYALRKPLLEMPPAEAAALIRTFPVKRLTIAKEVARLWGLLNTPEAFQELVALAGQVRHRDARIAVMRALWNHLDKDPAWAVLQEAGASPDVAVALMVTRTPFQGLGVQGLATCLVLFEQLLRHPEPRVRVALLQRLAKEPFPDPTRMLAPRIMEAIARGGDESTEAMNLLFAVYTGSGPDPIGPMLRWFGKQRERQHSLVWRLGEAVKTHRGQLLPAVRAALAALEPDPLTAHWRAELACRGLPWGELGDVLERMAEKDELHPDAYLAANQALKDGGFKRTDATTIEDLEARLRTSPHAVLRRLGYTALTTVRGSRAQSRSDFEAALAQYKADPSPWVASAAMF